MEKQEFIWIF